MNNWVTGLVETRLTRRFSNPTRIGLTNESKGRLEFDWFNHQNDAIQSVTKVDMINLNNFVVVVINYSIRLSRFIKPIYLDLWITI